jgi:rSAM/selenodomain-associated transferase 1
MKKHPVHLAILARKAELGVGKTRLAASVGEEAAYVIYQHLIRQTAKAALDSGLPATVYFDPQPGDEDVWPPEFFDYWVQLQTNDLGARIASALIQALDKASDLRKDGEETSLNTGAIVMGTDCPTLSGEIILEAAASLQTHDAVLGPTSDGGFYMLALRRWHPGIFADVSWSTEQVASQVVDNLRRLDFSFQLSPKLDDIDLEDDWLTYQKWRSAAGLEQLVLKDIF